MGGLSVGALEGQLGFAVLREVALGHEEALVRRVGVLVARAMDLVEHLLREEAAVAEEALVHGAELADAELRVADATATGRATARAPPLGRQREQANDLLEDLVAQLHAREARRAVEREERAVQAPEAEAAHVGAGVELRVEGELLRVPALVHEAEELGEALVEEVALARLGRAERDLLELAQHLEAVAAEVLLALHRQAAQLARLGLGVEEEEQAEEVDQALVGQLARGAIVVELALADGADVVDGLVAEELDRLAGRELQVRAHADRVLVRALDQRVVQGPARLRREQLAGEERDGDAQRGGIATTKERLEIEAEELTPSPARALREDDLLGPDGERPARR
jgi:hypothetical protein